MSGHTLSVWLFNDHLGHLAYDRGHLAFTYEAAWLENPAARPLSHSLPLQVETFGDRECRPFFAGLLPEGEMRKALAQQMQVSIGNDFVMLDMIGGECAGAVTFLPVGEALNFIQQPPSVNWLDVGQLEVLIADIRRRPMMAGTDGVRLSLAGAQDKLPVVVEGDRVGIPMFGMPSTHILKTKIDRVTGSVINECFCLDLAREIGIPAAHAHMGQTTGDTFLLVERYDRIVREGTLIRLHQEDFCQALGVATETKYQNEGGPSFTDSFNLVREATKPSARNLINLMRYAHFSTLVGNHDAHGKNYSLLYSASGTVLAPLYDVLCTAIYPDLTDKMAMKVGGKYSFTELHGRHWEKFAEEAGLGVAGARKQLAAMAQSLTAKATALAATDPYKGDPTIDLIVGLIMKRTRLTLDRLSLVAGK
jgi:serine/threonine-protein kinase HipA